MSATTAARPGPGWVRVHRAALAIAVLAVVAFVRSETRKKTGQAIAVETRAIRISETAPSTCGIRGAPDRIATGSRTAAPASSWPAASPFSKEP